jgi:hypothetical protein
MQVGRQRVPAPYRDVLRAYYESLASQPAP